MLSSAVERISNQTFRSESTGMKRTFEQLATVNLTRGDFERDNVALSTQWHRQRGGSLSSDCERAYGRSRRRGGRGIFRTIASLRSLIGMPIVLVILRMR